MKTVSEQNLPTDSPNGGFAPTEWTDVLEAGQNTGPALEALCRAYWYPLYAYLRRGGKDVHEAQDLTQGFFTFLLSGGVLAKARRERGRFRSFLLAALRHYVADEHEKGRAIKRGGGQRVLSLDEQDAEGRYLHEASEPMDPEKLYEKRWASTVVAQAMHRLRADYLRAGKQQLFAELESVLHGERLAVNYAEAGRCLGMSESAVKVTVHRLRRQLHDLIRQEITRTVATPQEAEDEVRHFLAVLGG